MNSELVQLLGDKAEALLNHTCKTVPRGMLQLPGPDFVDRVWSLSDRNNRVLGNLERLFRHGRLGGSGYLSILPVDQGIEHSAGASGKNDFGEAVTTAVSNKTLSAMHCVLSAANCFAPWRN